MIKRIQNINGFPIRFLYRYIFFLFSESTFAISHYSKIHDFLFRNKHSGLYLFPTQCSRYAFRISKKKKINKKQNEKNNRHTHKTEIVRICRTIKINLKKQVCGKKKSQLFEPRIGKEMHSMCERVIQCETIG